MYTYNAADQLTSATNYDSSSDLLSAVTYLYDAWGNMIERDEYDAPPTLCSGGGSDMAMSGFGGADAGIVEAGVTITRYGQDGWKVSQDFWGNRQQAVGIENFDVWAELDGSNNLTTRRFYGDGIDTITARINYTSGSGAVAWYFQDVRGSITAVANASGTIKATIHYDGYGNATIDSGSADPTYVDAYRYDGRWQDPTTGLQYNRNRWYDPLTGTWMSQDPLGMAAGDYNLTRYTGNDPTNFSDPSGLIGAGLAPSVYDAGASSSDVGPPATLLPQKVPPIMPGEMQLSPIMAGPWLSSNDAGVAMMAATYLPQPVTVQMPGEMQLSPIMAGPAILGQTNPGIYLADAQAGGPDVQQIYRPTPLDPLGVNAIGSWTLPYRPGDGVPQIWAGPAISGQINSGIYLAGMQAGGQQGRGGRGNDQGVNQILAMVKAAAAVGAAPPAAAVGPVPMNPPGTVYTTTVTVVGPSAPPPPPKGFFADAWGLVKDVSGFSAAEEEIRMRQLTAQIDAGNAARGMAPSLPDASPIVDYYNAFGQGVADGATIAANELTFHQVNSLDAEANRLIEQNGDIYRLSAAFSAIGTYSLCAAGVAVVGSVAAPLIGGTALGVGVTVVGGALVADQVIGRVSDAVDLYNKGDRIGAFESGAKAGIDVVAVFATVGGSKPKGTGEPVAPVARTPAQLAQRATQIHEVNTHPAALNGRTVAVLETSGGDIVGGGVRDLSPTQRKAFGPGEIAARLPGEHAEITALQDALNRGLRPRAIGTSRDFCPDCIRALEGAGARITGPRTAVWD